MSFMILMFYIGPITVLEGWVNDYLSQFTDEKLLDKK